MARFLSVLLLLSPLSVLAHMQDIPPVLRPIQPQITMLDAATRKVQITVRATIDSAGDLTLQMRIPHRVSQLQSENATVTLKHSQDDLSAGTAFSQSFVTYLPRNGHFLFNFNYDWEVEGRSKSGNIPIYVVMSAGSLNTRRNYLVPAPTFVKERPTLAHTLPAPKPTDTPVSIKVKIKGKVMYRNPYTDDDEPVAGVKVLLDWDRDNNERTVHVPPGHPTEYPTTNTEGEYEFDFTVSSSPVSASYYRQIRIFAEKKNDATHPTAKKNAPLERYFADFHYVYPAIDEANTFKSTTANIEPEPLVGLILRHALRAREFATKNLKETPPSIAYVINNSASSAFCGSQLFRGCQIYQELPTMRFKSDARSAVIYHEYGHWFEYHILGGQFSYAGTSTGHTFTTFSNDTVAWSEGFASFFAGAGHNYWYARELPSKPEYHKYLNDPWTWEFYDADQRYIPTGGDRKQNEGAVACFLYSLWDGVERRAPGYMGDNDDLTIPGRKILNAVVGRRRSNPQGPLKLNTSIESFRAEIKKQVAAYLHPSIDALYDWMFLSSPPHPARSATATELTVMGDWNSRTLNWIDNTSPAIFTWDFRTWNIENNPEAGFKIYRKVAGDEADYSLSNYRVAGRVAANVTTWTDPIDLDSGTYAYIVTAFNSGGDSAPRVVRNISVTRPSITLTGPSEVEVDEGTTGSLGQYEATSNGTVEWLPLAGDDAGDFTLAQVGTNTNQRSLTFNTVPDYEDPKDEGKNNVYNVTVEVQIQGEANTKLSQPTEITVTDVQDTDRPGTVSFTNADPPRVNAKIVATVTDLDNPQLDSATWSWTLVDGVSGSAPVGNEFTPSISTIGKRVKLTVTYTDDYGTHTLTKTTQEVQASLNVPGAPRNLTATPSEGQVALTWEAAPHNGSPITHYERAHRLVSPTADLSYVSVPGPNDRAQDARSVTVTGLDNDTEYRFFVRAHNGNGSGSPAAKNARTPVVNGSPTVDCPETPSIDEGGSSPWQVTECEASDPDQDRLTWDLEGEQKDYFKVTGTGYTRKLEFKAKPNHEHRETYGVTVKVTDPDGASGKDGIVVSVDDVNEPPSVDCPETPSRNENGDSPWHVADCTASDPDENDRLSWGTSGDQGSYFKFTGSGLTRQMEFTANPNHEHRETYGVTAVVTDKGGLLGTDGITVTVRDVNESPSLTGPSSVTVVERTKKVGTYTASDPDADETLTWSVTPTATFELKEVEDESLKRELHFKGETDHNVKDSYSATVKVVDSGNLSATQSTAISISDVDDPGTITFSPSSPRVGEKVTATLKDKDGGIDEEVWIWRRQDSPPASSASGSSVPDLSSTSTYTTSLLDLDKRLRVDVEYDDNHGQSKTAQATTASVRPNKPGPPKAVVTAISDETVTLSWSAADHNGSPITRYDYHHANRWRKAGDGTARSVSVTGLTNGTEFTFKLKAKNGVGYGPEVTVKDTPADVPGVPPDFTATHGDSSITLSWDEAEGNGAAVTYEVHRMKEGSAVWGPWNSTGQSRTRTDSELDNGTQYNYEVRGSNRAGKGATASASATPSREPSAPKNLTTDRPAIGSVRITWEAADDNGAPITRYQYRRKVGTGNSNWRGWFTVSGGGSARSRTVTGLRDLLRYTWEVRAYNLNGYGATASVVTQPKGLPGGASGSSGESTELDNIGSNEGEPDTPMDDQGPLAKPLAASYEGPRTYPNPFNSSVSFVFALEKEGPVSLKVYNTAGQLVRILEDAPGLSAGWHVRHWHGDDQEGGPVGSGIYLYRLIAGGEARLGKVALIR